MRPGPSRCWARVKAPPRSPRRFSRRHAHVRVAHLRLGVERRRAGRVVHREDGPQLDARRVGRDDDHRRSPMAVRVGIRDGHQHVEVAAIGVADEPLGAVDDPLVALEDGRGGELRRVGAGALLGHRERAVDLACQQRCEPLRLLLGGRGDRQELRVARVRRLVAEDRWRELAAAQDLVHQAELDLAISLAAELGTEVRRPQPLLPDGFHEWRCNAQERRVVELERLQRVDLLAHELAHPRQLALELGVGAEVPGHAGHAMSDAGHGRSLCRRPLGADSNRPRRRVAPERGQRPRYGHARRGGSGV